MADKRTMDWRIDFNNREELEYLSHLKNPKDILDYRNEREAEVFLNAL
tara:strand:+ start:1588 stop:1731 length:144 start_codon:yes stop_codon:yes gene_type:complete